MSNYFSGTTSWEITARGCPNRAVPVLVLAEPSTRGIGVADNCAFARGRLDVISQDVVPEK